MEGINKGERPVQNIIPDKVIKIAKAMQEADRYGAHLIIVQKRQWGKTIAAKLAKGEQILPTNLHDSN